MIEIDYSLIEFSTTQKSNKFIKYSNKGGIINGYKNNCL